MRTLTRLSVIACAALLGACATPYAPESVENQGGYGESRRDPGVYQVWFTAQERRAEVRGMDLALLHAAELCLADNQPFMRTSDFKIDILDFRVARGLRATQNYRYVEGTSLPFALMNTSNLTSVPGPLFFTRRNGLVVACLPEKAADVEESAVVAAVMRERYGVATESTLQTPSR